jgi:hypothetical protein
MRARRSQWAEDLSQREYLDGAVKPSLINNTTTAYHIQLRTMFYEQLYLFTEVTQVICRESLNALLLSCSLIHSLTPQQPPPPPHKIRPQNSTTVCSLQFLVE